MRFFKKLEPKNNPLLGNGSAVVFNSVDNPLVGYYATDNEYVIGEFVRLMGEGRYGISEITAEEFVRDYVEPKKKGLTSRPVWREEMGSRESLSRGLPVMEQLGAQRVSETVAVAAADQPPPRSDGPTESEYRAAGYKGEYPPPGYAARPEGSQPVPMADSQPPQPNTPDLRGASRVGKRRAQPKQSPLSSQS